MAEAVVSITLEALRDLLLEEGRFLSGVGSEVKALEMQLKEMKCLLEDADRLRHESKTVANWIVEIRDLAYRAEDAIETYAAQFSSKRRRGLKNLIGRSSCILKEYYSLHKICSEISQIKSDLERVSKSMRDFGIRSIIEGESSTTDINQQWKRKTFPHFQIEDCFVGKDDELKQIVSLLVHDEQHRVVSIWGMGGLGKTTIAKKAYNHIDTKRHFQSFAWVCISQQCEIRSVLEDVLNQLNPPKKDVTPPERDVRSLTDTELIKELRQIQKDKHCIIVLDDFWKTDHWDGLKHAFLVEGLKSKILVTTRNQSVVGIGFSMQLGLLSMESGWELLKKKAFPGTNNIPDFAFDEEKLREIGNEMVKKCGFLPLKISLLGGVLSKRKSMRDWELAKENINAYLHRDSENEIGAVLNLSYEDLPYYLKPCFLYLGLFKEDQRIQAQDLYRLWIAQGMISNVDRQYDESSFMVIAELYLSELASRSIVEVKVVDDDSNQGNNYKWCKLHDVVRHLCLSVGKREGFGVQTLYYKGGKLLHDSLSGVRVKTRHLAIYFDRKFKAEFDKEAFKNVRTLLLFNDDTVDFEFQDIGIDLQIFKLLRVLTFRSLRFEKGKVTKWIGNLIHLRYWCFKRCELDELPSTIRNLSYLQTLDLSNSRNVGVSNDLKDLLRLKHLLLPVHYGDRDRVVAGYYALKLDEGVDHELETLMGFNSSAHQVKSLTRLKNLQRFEGRVRDNESLLTVIDSITTKWSKLRFCSIDIRKGCKFLSARGGEGVMDMKKVLGCPKLDYLRIGVVIGKQLEECRSCVSSSTIVRLVLEYCWIEDDPMDILGKFPVLRNLHLSLFSYVGEEMRCPEFSFPRLKKLKLSFLIRLREWRVEEGAMPLLSQIKIGYCPDLRMLPDGLKSISTLQKLKLVKMGLSEEELDKVRHVPSIINLHMIPPAHLEAAEEEGGLKEMLKRRWKSKCEEEVE